MLTVIYEKKYFWFIIGHAYRFNTVESTLFLRMEWIRNLIRISDSTAFVSMLSNLLRIQSYEWSRFVTWSVSRCTAFVSIYIRNLIRHMATFISTRRNNLFNGLIRPIRLSESTRYIRIHSSQITCIWLVNLRKRLLFDVTGIWNTYDCLLRSFGTTELSNVFRSNHK